MTLWLRLGRFSVEKCWLWRYNIFRDCYELGDDILKYYGLRNKIKKKILYIRMQNIKLNYYQFYRERERHFGKIIMIQFMGMTFFI